MNDYDIIIGQAVLDQTNEKVIVTRFKEPTKQIILTIDEVEMLVSYYLKLIHRMRGTNN